MHLKKPEKLRIGDKVYIISPSAGIIPFAENRASRAYKNLTALGLKVVFSKYSKRNDGYVSAKVKDRVADIHSAFMDKDCKMIMASIGGNHCNQLLDSLNYELIKNNPKILIGYSDITVLHYALATKANLQTFYGPCFLTQFGEFPNVLPYTLEHFKQILFQQKNSVNINSSMKYTDETLDWFKNEDSKRRRNLVKNKGYVWWNKGVSTGWAFPATIPSLNHLIGTKYMPKIENAILMLDIPEGNSIFEGLSVGEFDSWLSDLYNCGLLSKINGMVIGRPYKYNEAMIANLKRAVLRITRKYSYPILFNADFGHTDPMLTIPIASQVTLDSTDPFSCLRIKY